MGEKILWLIKTFALLFNRLLSAWLVTDANCSSTQLTVKLYPLWFSYILWLGVDSSRRRCRVSNTPQSSSFYRLFYVLCTRPTDSYCCHMPWQVTGDSSLLTLFQTLSLSPDKLFCRRISRRFWNVQHCVCWCFKRTRINYIDLFMLWSNKKNLVTRKISKVNV